MDLRWTNFGAIFNYIENITPLQEDFTLMMSVTSEKAARNVLMDLLFTLTKHQEHQSKIASPVQKVTIKISIRNQMFTFSCSKHLDARSKRRSTHKSSSPKTFEQRLIQAACQSRTYFEKPEVIIFNEKIDLILNLKKSVQIRKKKHTHLSNFFTARAIFRQIKLRT